MGRNIRYALLGMAMLAVANPALADVKTGVDAWARGEYEAAIREWQGPAAKGDADALFNMGQAYKLGRGVKQDLARAEMLFGQAAAQGHIQASDNYGLLLFERGERARALPYITAASDRGDPRAQYLLGVAHFNGDIVEKDWVRAYALTSLSRQSGLPQATAALAQMDEYIPIEQRQQGVAMATELAEQSTATRARQLAALDLGSQAPGAPAAAAPPATIRTPRAPALAAIPRADQAVNAAERTAAGSSPRSAGADYARPATAPLPAAAPVTRPAPARPAAASGASGPWRVQLGAFGVAGNAEALWDRVSTRPEVAGRQRLLLPTGRVTRLQAGGYASQGEAQNACDRLKAGGYSCLVTRN